MNWKEINIFHVYTNLCKTQVSGSSAPLNIKYKKHKLKYLIKCNLIQNFILINLKQEKINMFAFNNKKIYYNNKYKWDTQLNWVFKVT